MPESGLALWWWKTTQHSLLQRLLFSPHCISSGTKNAAAQRQSGCYPTRKESQKASKKTHTQPGTLIHFMPLNSDVIQAFIFHTLLKQGWYTVHPKCWAAEMKLVSPCRTVTPRLDVSRVLWNELLAGPDNNPSAAGTYSNTFQSTGTGTGLSSAELFPLHLQRTDRR